jgi:hypothetical protein
MALRNEDLETYVSEEDWEMLVDEGSPWSIDLSICVTAIISLILLSCCVIGGMREGNEDGMPSILSFCVRWIGCLNFSNLNV